jgi:hypothetical protein
MRSSAIPRALARHGSRLKRRLTQAPRAPFTRTGSRADALLVVPCASGSIPRRMNDSSRSGRRSDDPGDVGQQRVLSPRLVRVACAWKARIACSARPNAGVTCVLPSVGRLFCPAWAVSASGSRRAGQVGWPRSSGQALDGLGGRGGHLDPSACANHVDAVGVSAAPCGRAARYHEDARWPVLRRRARRTACEQAVLTTRGASPSDCSSARQDPGPAGRARAREREHLLLAART